MNKIKNRFIALLVVFTSIISFLPAAFSGQAANAATIPDEATAIKVYAEGSLTPIAPTTDTTANETIYSTAIYEAGGFDIALKDVTTTQAELLKEANLKKVTTSGTASGIVGQKVEIISINGASCNTAAGKAILSELGIDFSKDSADPNSSTKIIGKLITGLPLGVNKIEYKISITTQDVDYTAATKDSNNNTVAATTTINNPVEESYSTKKLTIYHGTGYATNKIKAMIFKSYIGTGFYDDDDKLDNNSTENNTTPFLYSTTATADKDMALKYTFDVPDSTTTLKYIMTFDSTIPLEGATVYKNGAKATEGTEYQLSGKTLTGNLESLNKDSDLIMVKLNSTGTSNIVEKSYSIEIRYNNLSSNEDYSLKSSGITKSNYADDNSVKAYIGKKFDVTQNSAGFTVYTGDIYINKKATMISIDPNLIRSKSTVAYVVTNNYYDESTKSIKVQKSILKNGKQFIDFMASKTGSNEIQVDVYEGTNGSKTTSSKMLARYILKVNLLTTDAFALDLAFDNNSNSSTYLTQPGVKANDVDFTTDRRTYDLYSSDPVNVSFALNSENDKYTGIRSGKNEYLRVWLASTVDSNTLTEAQASLDNTLDSNNIRKTNLNIDLNNAQKMVVQAYYDDITQTTTGAQVCVSYAVGDEYIFYLPNNYVPVENPDNGSNNAYLNSIKVTGGTLTDGDGKEKFTNTVLDYTVSVPKDDKTAKITATAEDDNVKSIVATINGGTDSYDLVSGEALGLPLDADGKTIVNIVVTAQDGVTTKKYTLIINNNTKSSNVSLSNVILSTGEFTFDPTKQTTKVRVSQSTTSIKVTPIPQDPNAKITVDGTAYEDAAITVNLRGSQETDIVIVVKSEDGAESKTYTLEVYRTDSADWNTGNDGDDKNQDDQYYDKYYQCWVDTTKYEEWGKVDSKVAYFDKNNRQVKDAWITTDHKLYYLNSSGYRASGWKIEEKSGKTYYLDPTTGEMRKEWMNLNGSVYYLGLNGVMHKGWLSLNQKWYYFTPNGQMVIGQSMFVDDKEYKFGQDGAIY